MTSSAIVWFRRDLRLDDNPALAAAHQCADRVVALYIHNPAEENPWLPGAASQWWLHHSLQALAGAIARRGGQLWITRGDSLHELQRIAALTNAGSVHWNRLYDPVTRERDTRIKQSLRAQGLEAHSHPGNLLFEPWEITRPDRQPYKVFTAFWRTACANLARLRRPTDPFEPRWYTGPMEDQVPLEALELLPCIGWDAGLRSTWQVGAEAALVRAREFVMNGLDEYAQQRDFPEQDGVSRLSPALHFGEISPQRILECIRARGADDADLAEDPFVRQLLWRDFAHHLLYHFPDTTEQPLDAKFTDFPWREDTSGELLRLWQRGQTGIPLVDAGMRELWHTGGMHNRVRMVVASLLTKQLRLPWQTGARWFWDTLVDADLANNTMGWQWVAGCGADAAPYFRIFNPVRQGERFDPSGGYVRHWCPELKRLPDKYIHQPWAAPAGILTQAGVRPGENWPRPVVDLAQARQEALAAWEQIRSAAGSPPR